MKEEILNVRCPWCEVERPCRVDEKSKPDGKWAYVECSECGEIFTVVFVNGTATGYDELLEKNKAST
jgi:ribosomal protein S27E